MADGLPTYGQVATLIRMARLDAGVGQAELGDRCGYTSAPNSPISALERWRVMPSPEKLARMIQILGFSLEDFRKAALALKDVPRPAASKRMQVDGDAANDFSIRRISESQWKQISRHYFESGPMVVGGQDKESVSTKSHEIRVTPEAARLPLDRKLLNDHAEMLEERRQALIAKCTKEQQSWARALKQLEKEVVVPALKACGVGEIYESGRGVQGRFYARSANLVDDALKSMRLSGKLEPDQWAQIGSLTLMGSLTGGALAGGVFTAVGTFGVASTGTALAALSGVAATDATLAAIGGGSLAAGGAGILGGSLVLGGLVLLPILAAGVLAYHKIAEAKQSKLHDFREHVVEFELALIRAEQDTAAILRRGTAATELSRETCRVFLVARDSLVFEALADEPSRKDEIRRDIKSLLVVAVAILQLPIDPQVTLEEVDGSPNEGASSSPASDDAFDAEIHALSAELTAIRVRQTRS